MKLSSDYSLQLRIRESFDFLRVHKHDLTPEQQDRVNEIFIQRRDNHGLTESQVQELFNLVKSFRPVETLRVRKNY